MNNQFRKFFNALKGTDVGTQVVIAMSSVAMLAAIAVVGMVSSETHFEVVWSDLSETEAGRVSTALANKGVEFRQQRSDSKVVIVVASNEVSAAHQAAAEEGAIIGMEKGIFAASSAGGVFDGAGARSQKLEAAQWSQAEKMLEVLDFVTEALIQCSLNDSASSRNRRPKSGSVTIRTVGGIALTEEEGQRVAKTVINALGVDPDLLTIMDTNGRSVYTPKDENDVAGSLAVNFQREHDLVLAGKVQRAVDKRYGPNKVDIVVNSTFDFTQSTISRHEPLKAVKLSERSLITSTPSGINGNAGGIPGTTSNTPIGPDKWGDDPADISAVAGASPNSTTEEKESKSAIGYLDSLSTSTQPKLTLLSISVGIDSELAAIKESIDADVKAMVGFDEARGDTFSSSAETAFYVPEIPEGSEGLTPVMSEQGLDTNFLIEKGVEIVSALAFIILLLKGFKSAKGSSVGASTVSTNSSGFPITIGGDGTPMPEIEIAPEQLARAQVDDLVKNNPERVAQILSNWVVEDRNAVNS
jgi:flagellar M-ring protein FliF